MPINRIRRERDLLYDTIKEAKKQLTILRMKCPHTDKSIVDYAWRVGAMNKGLTCDDCGVLIKFVK